MAHRRPRRRFTREYKAQAVQRVIESGLPLADIAAERPRGDVTVQRRPHEAQPLDAPRPDAVGAAPDRHVVELDALRLVKYDGVVAGPADDEVLNADVLGPLDLEGDVLGVLSAWGKVPGKLDFAHNIAVDSRGDIYVSEIKNWRVQKFAK